MGDGSAVVRRGVPDPAVGPGRLPDRERPAGGRGRACTRWTKGPFTADRERLSALARGGRTPQRVALRARTVLGAAAGRSNNSLAAEPGITRPTILVWRERFAEAGVDGLLEDTPQPGRKERISAAKVETIVNVVLHDEPADATRWTRRTSAKARGVSSATVQRIWSARGLQPHRVETFKPSRDPEFVGNEVPAQDQRL